MDSIKQKVVFDLIGHPATLLPVTLGLTVTFISIIAGWPLGIFGGIAAAVAGCGIAASRFIFNLESMTQKAYELSHQERLEKQDRELDELDEKLARDGDKRTHRSLRTLRDIGRQLKEGSKEGRMSGNVHRILSQFEDLFDACIESLKVQLYIYEDLRDKRITGKRNRQNAAEDRENTIQEVVDSVEHISKMITTYHGFTIRRNDSELSKLRAELDRSLQAAEKAEQARSAGFEEKGYDINKFRKTKT